MEGIGAVVGWNPDVGAGFKENLDEVLALGMNGPEERSQTRSVLCSI